MGVVEYVLSPHRSGRRLPEEFVVKLSFEFDTDRDTQEELAVAYRVLGLLDELDPAPVSPVVEMREFVEALSPRVPAPEPETVEEPAAAAAPEPETEPEPAPAPESTGDVKSDTVAAAKRVAATAGPAKLKSLLDAVGAKRVTEMTDEQSVAFLDAVKEAGL